MKKLLILIITVSILLAAGAGWYLIDSHNKEQEANLTKEIDIVLAEPLTSLNPYTFTAANDQRLRLIYEPLVKLDEKLNLKPSLATSFGRLDEKTWEFRLNANAVFHDGSKLSAQVVKDNLDMLLQLPEAQGVVDSIESVEVTGELTFHINTKYVDPILLNKLSQIPITPSRTFYELEEHPVGTGPYEYNSSTENFFTATKFENYYGDTPLYDAVKISTRIVAEERISYANGRENVALIYPYPIALKGNLDENKFTLQRANDLGVNFFLFNFNRGWNSKAMRDVLIKSLDDNDLLQLTDELGTPVSQYVARGVFGFNSDLDIEKYESRDEIEEALRSVGLYGEEIKVAMAPELEIFKDFLSRHWARSGLNAEIDLVDIGAVINSNIKNNYDLIFIGWKSDFGDSSSFFDNIATTSAEFNIGSYSNPQVDANTELAAKELDISARQQLLEELMRQVSIDDPIGIPLFESEIIYAVENKYEYTPRADGFIDINNLILK